MRENRFKLRYSVECEFEKCPEIQEKFHLLMITEKL